MKILVFTQHFWPEDFRINDLATSLRKRGHEVTVLTGFPNYPNGRVFPGYSIKLFQREVYDGVSIIRVPIYPDNSYSLIKRGWTYLSFLLSASLLGPFLIGRAVSIVVFQPGPITVGIPAIIFKYIKRAPVFLWVQDIWPDTLKATGLIRQSWIITAVSWMVHFIYCHCDVILAQSRGFISKIVAMGQSPTKVVYMPNWSEALYHPVKRDDKFAQREGMVGGFYVLFAGNIGRSQDFETLLGAAEILRSEPGIYFIILGDGAMAQHHMEKALAAKLDNVVFMGRKPVEAMPHYFALADALLVLLKREPIFSLTIPSKLQSYMACGRPILAAVEGEAAAIIRESGAGIVCDPGNPAALAEAICTMYRLPREQRESFGQAAMAYYRAHFDREKILARFETLLINSRTVAAR